MYALADSEQEAQPKDWTALSWLQQPLLCVTSILLPWFCAASEHPFSFGAECALCRGPCPPPGSLDNSALKVLQSPPKWGSELCCQAALTARQRLRRSLATPEPAFAISSRHGQEVTAAIPQLTQPQAHSLSTDNQPVLVPSCCRRLPWLNTSFTPTCMFTSGSCNYV